VATRGISTLGAQVLLGAVLFINIFHFGALSLGSRSPAENHLGYLAIGVPVFGGLVVGLLARYGSEQIRGHGHRGHPVRQEPHAAEATALAIRGRGSSRG
jgi:hypothetical protein